MTDWSRLAYVDYKKTQRVNPLLYPFLFQTFVYGLGFSTFFWWGGVSSSSLFQAMLAVHSFIPVVWGGFAVLATLLAVVLFLTRRAGWFGEVASILGFLVWLFAAIIYAMNGFWLVLLTVTGPALFFWTWYYMRVKDLQRKRLLA